MRDGDDLPPGVHLILCEGPEDRAFWNGLLKFRGWDRVHQKAGRDERAYTLGTPDKPGADDRPYVEVLPVGGYDQLERALRAKLKEDRTKRVLREVLLNYDTDLSDADRERGLAGKTPAGVREGLRAKDLACDDENGGRLRITGTDCRITLVPWKSAGPKRDGVPKKETLERLVCDAIATAHPARAAAVEAWLNARPEIDPAAEPHRHKSAALSYYAGWYPGGGSFAFFEGLWRDPPVTAELEKSLTAAGTWAAVDRLLGGAPPDPAG